MRVYERCYNRIRADKYATPKAHILGFKYSFRKPKLRTTRQMPLTPHASTRFVMVRELYENKKIIYDKTFFFSFLPDNCSA